jgi:hypothetical protein
MLLERLRQTGEIPAGSPERNVRALLDVLLARLVKHLESPYVWNAVAYRAVMAGSWGGERRRRQRRKLRAQIQACCRYLNIGDPTASFPDGWEGRNLIYGFGAVHQLQERTGLDILTLCLLAPRTGGK